MPSDSSALRQNFSLTIYFPISKGLQAVSPIGQHHSIPFFIIPLS
jgi:hypothetical protein